MSENKKVILIALIAAAVTLGGLYLKDTMSPATTSESVPVAPENKIPHDVVGDLIEEGNFEAARQYVEREDTPLNEMQLEVQKNRIETLESYDSFYSSGDASSYASMLEDVKVTIDNYFLVIDSPEASDVEKSYAYLAVAFAYTETWSDKALLEHIAQKLGVAYSPAAGSVEQAAVFNELFTRTIDLYPTQDAYLKRAWFNSRLLLTEDFADDSEVRTTLLASIEADLAESNARSGMRFTSQARYYNSYNALAFADILDFLYQEGRLDTYGEVAYAYNQALTYADGDFLGHRIVQDIIRMNYAASLYRAEDSQPNNQAVVEILTPVAEHIREYSSTPALAYEGILVMLRRIPQQQNLNNNSLRTIFTTYTAFSDIPALLRWGNDSAEAQPFVFKLI